MENWTETASNEIISLVEKVLQDERGKMNGTPEEIIARTTLQIGIMEDLEIEVTPRGRKSKSEIDVFIPHSSAVRASSMVFENPLTEIQLTEELFPVLKKKLIAVIQQYDKDPFLNYIFSVSAQFRVVNKGDVKFTVVEYINEQKVAQLKQNIEQYIETKLINGKYPLKKLEVSFFSSGILSPVLYPKKDVSRIITLFDKIQELNKKQQETLKEHKHNIVYALKNWVEKQFLPKYYDVTGNKWSPEYTLKKEAKVEQQEEPLFDLVVYTAILILKNEPNYSRTRGIQFLNQITELGFLKAKELLKTGSGQFELQEVYYKDSGIEFIANDILATFTITIKEENVQNYSKALDLICNLLKKDFPKSYQIKFKSKEKNFLPIKKLGKNSTQRFFANALQYMELYEQLAEYAKTAIHEYEWYEDAEAEHCAMPGTYAVFGLGLVDNKYFPLVEEYLSVVDDEHQSVQSYFLEALVEKQGINEDSISVIVKGLSVSYDEIIKKAKLKLYFDTIEKNKLLLDSLKNYKSYQIGTILYSIWGTKEDLEKEIRKQKGELRVGLEKIKSRME